MILIVRGHINGKVLNMTRNGKWTKFEFGRALRRRRHKLGLSQEAFADLCHLDRTYIGGIERGERNVALVNIEKISKTLRISISELFRGV
jgi:transcriptional regulator with XRE-family HTH domain